MRHDTELIPLEALTRVDKPRLSQTLPIRKGKKWWERDPNAAPREDADVRAIATSGWLPCRLEVVCCVLCHCAVTHNMMQPFGFACCVISPFGASMRKTPESRWCTVS